MEERLGVCCSFLLLREGSQRVCCSLLLCVDKNKTDRIQGSSEAFTKKDSSRDRVRKDTSA